MFAIDKVETESQPSSFKADFFYNSPHVLSLTASPRKDVRRVKWFEFRNTRVAPLDHWEFFVQKLDEGIQKTRLALVSAVSHASPFSNFVHGQITVF